MELELWPILEMDVMNLRTSRQREQKPPFRARVSYRVAEHSQKEGRKRQKLLIRAKKEERKYTVIHIKIHLSA
jgi:hypothetical protein